MDNTENIKLFIRGIFNSYSQVFFSDRLLFAILLMVVSFFDFYAGLSGITSIVIANSFAWGLGFDKHKIAQGLYGFNVLLVSLGLGVMFRPGFHLLILLLLSAVLTLFLTIVTEGVLGKYKLPFLSIPFLIALWLLTLASREFSSVGISERGIYTLNDIYSIGGMSLINLFNWWNELPIFLSLKTYFMSLGAIFFQYNALAGLLIAIGMLIYSRIAFCLSLIGFYTAYIFYQITGANITEISYSYIGFNYILTSIAVGGFFLVPSIRSYIWTVMLIPMVAIVTISLNTVFSVFQLPIFSLPFNIVVLLYLYVLNMRSRSSSGLIDIVMWLKNLIFRTKSESPTALSLVNIQQYSPERNLYSHQNSIKRFKNATWFNLRLPFWGEWTVSQDHDGKITHLGDWKHAWDFVIKNSAGSTFCNNGDFPEDYFCYEKRILSPLDGRVEDICDNIEDNIIGQVDLENNWGNTIVIKHAEYLYTSLSHMKKGSFEVKKGDFVQQGQVVGKVGNSGRSPEPHLHMQVQATPFIGSQTIDYPLGHYILKTGDSFVLNSYGKPKKDDLVSNIEVNELLKKAFNLIPGMKMSFEVSGKNYHSIEEWEVFKNAMNKSYIYCKRTKSIAWFINDGNLLLFDHFEGSKSSILYYFFLAAYKIQYGFYEGLELKDIFPANLLFGRPALFLQDFVAPFGIYLKSLYTINYIGLDDSLNPSTAVLKSEVFNSVMGRKKKFASFDLEVDRKGIKKIVISSNDRQLTAESISL